MHPSPKARWFAAPLFAVAAIAPLYSWWLLLFYAKPTSLSTTDAALAQLGSTFSSTNPERWWFIGWALLPIFLIVAALIYCSRLVLSRRWSIFAACAVFAVTVLCLAFAPSLGMSYSFPLLWQSGGRMATNPALMKSAGYNTLICIAAFVVAFLLDQYFVSLWRQALIEGRSYPVTFGLIRWVS